MNSHEVARSNSTPGRSVPVQQRVSLKETAKETLPEPPPDETTAPPSNAMERLLTLLTKKGILTTQETDFIRGPKKPNG